MKALVACIWLLVGIPCGAGAQALIVELPKVQEIAELKAAKNSLTLARDKLAKDNKYRRLIEQKFISANLFYTSWNAKTHPLHVEATSLQTDVAAFFVEKKRYDDDGDAYEAEVLRYNATEITDENKSMMAEWKQRLQNWQLKGQVWTEKLETQRIELAERSGKFADQLDQAVADWRDALRAFDAYTNGAIHIGEIETKIIAIDKQIKQDKMALERFQRQIPGFFTDIEEMAKQADSTRQENASTAIGLGFSLAIDATMLNKLAGENLAKAKLKDVKNALIKGGIKPDHVKKIMAGWEDGPSRIKTMVNERQMIESLSQIMDFASTLDTATKHQYWEALASALSFFVQSPVLKLIKTNAEVYTNLLHTGLAYATAKARVNQFSKLSDTQLKAVDSLTKVTVKHVKEKQKLVREREQLKINYGL